MAAARRITAGTLSAVVVALAVPGWASPRSDAAAGAAEYLATRRQANGALFAPDAMVHSVAEAVTALVAAGGQRPTVDAALRYMRARASQADGPGRTALLVLGVVAAGADPRDFGGADQVARMDASYDATTGAWTAQLYQQALAMLATVASGGEVPERALTYVRARRCPGGGYSWQAGCVAPDVDTTAMVVSALSASGVGAGDPAVAGALDWLHAAQDRSGGFSLEPGEPVNANSTALALSALTTSGADRQPRWSRGGGDPASVLMSLRHPSGGIRYTAGEAAPGEMATVQAIPALAGVPYPVRPRAEGRASTAPAPRVRAVASPSPSPAPVSSPTSSPAGEVPASGTAAVLVVAGSDRREACVELGPQVTDGARLLEATGFDAVVQASSGAVAVCSIGGRGCSADDCFCSYPTFWGYWTRDAADDGWMFSEIGASDRTVADGSADAWVWGPDGGPEPPDIDAAAICAAAPPAASDAPAEPARSRTNVVAMLAVAGVLVVGGAVVVARRGA